MLKQLLEDEEAVSWEKLKTAVLALKPNVKAEILDSDLTAKPPIKNKHLKVTYRGKEYRVLNFHIPTFDATVNHVKNFIERS